MAKFVVLPIAMSIKNNGVAKAGDLVDESQLNSSPYELIKTKFIRPATDEELKAAGEDFVEAEIVDDSGLSDEEKAAIAHKEKEEQEAAELKKKEEEEAAEKLRLEEEEKAKSANENKSAKDSVKDQLTGKK